MNSEPPKQSSKIEQIIDEEVYRIIEAGRSMLPEEVWDYIASSSHEGLTQTSEFTTFHTTTDYPIEKCHHTQNF